MNPPDLPARPATDLCLFMARCLTGVGLSSCLNQTGKQRANCYGIPPFLPCCCWQCSFPSITNKRTRCLSAENKSLHCALHFVRAYEMCVSAAWNKMQRDPGLKDAAWRRSKEFGLQMLFGASAVH